MLYKPELKDHKPASFGLSAGNWDILNEAFRSFPEIEQVLLFGSRAIGTAGTGADIDLAVYGQDFSHQLLGKLNSVLEDSKLRYFVDIVVPGPTTSKGLLESINKQGVLIYKRGF